jgi:transcriptional regulator GlxA family with amidase domain
MTVLKRRSRMVSFRLSDEEYEGLKHICIAVGARSLSDVARDAVHRLLGSAAEPKTNWESQLAALSGRMDALDREVKRLISLMEQSPESNSRFDTVRS